MTIKNDSNNNNIVNNFNNNNINSTILIKKMLNYKQKLINSQLNGFNNYNYWLNFSTIKKMSSLLFIKNTNQIKTNYNKIFFKQKQQRFTKMLKENANNILINNFLLITKQMCCTNFLFNISLIFLLLFPMLCIGAPTYNHPPNDIGLCFLFFNINFY